MKLNHSVMEFTSCGVHDLFWLPQPPQALRWQHAWEIALWRQLHRGVRRWPDLAV